MCKMFVPFAAVSALRPMKPCETFTEVVLPFSSFD